MALFSRAPRPDAAPDRSAAPAKAKTAAKPKKRPPLAQDIQVSPFFADHTRAGLADRFNELRSKRSDQVLVTLCLGLCLLASLGMNAYQISRGTVEVVGTVYSPDGELLRTELLKPMDNVNDILLQRELRGIIKSLRTITTDPAATQERFAEAYGKVMQGSGAAVFLTDFYDRAADQRRAITSSGGQRSVVEFTGPQRVGDSDTWTVSWVERTAAGSGNQAGVTQDVYSGSIVMNRTVPSDLETAQANPLGVYITGIDWTQNSSRVLELDELSDIATMEALYPGLSVSAEETTLDETAPRPTAPAAE